MATDDLRRRANAAKTDRPLVARGLTDPGSMRQVIWPAFRDDVAPWATLDYEQEVVAGRLIASLTTADGGDRPTVAIVSSPILFDRAGLLAAVEIAFADLFPAGWTDPAGRWVPLYVQPIVAVYNSHRAHAFGAWPDLADPALRGRLTFDDPARMLTTGPAMAELSTTLGTEWPGFVTSLARQAPLLVGDNERAVLEVGTGARWVGLSNWNVARRVRNGSPVRHAFLAPTPCVPGFGLLVRNAPNAALGRLFLAWLSSPRGQRAYADTGRIPAMPDVDASLSLERILPPGIKPLFGTTDWLTEPEKWAARFRELLPMDRGPSLEGKLR